jgi:hypothetical protein
MQVNDEEYSPEVYAENGFFFKEEGIISHVEQKEVEI